jgi:hypothetical protein
MSFAKTVVVKTSAAQQHTANLIDPIVISCTLILGFSLPLFNSTRSRRIKFSVTRYDRSILPAEDHSAAISGGMNITKEVRGSMDADAGYMAKEIADRTQAFYERRRWL